MHIWFNIKIAIKISDSKSESTQVIFEETKRVSEIDTTARRRRKEIFMLKKKFWRCIFLMNKFWSKIWSGVKKN